MKQTLKTLGEFGLYLTGMVICLFMWKGYDDTYSSITTKEPTQEDIITEEPIKVVQLPVTNETPEVIVLSVHPDKPHPCWKEIEEEIIHADIQNWHCISCGDYVAPRYGFTDDEIFMLAQLLCGEEGIHGDGEYDFEYQVLYPKLEPVNYYEISKVLCVVMNRVRDERFPNAVYDILIQPGQFYNASQYLKSPPTCAIEEVQNWCYHYDTWSITIQSIPEDHVFYEGDGITNTTRSEY